ncbi:hypothetical protein L6164_001347 [Bauhinia variegata]|uniref:Uncharacterized protein n=1 Tax=Bauhinia variegata TaxID=167791 RepID=A0ACB9Q982_BAUVA|nr:hypothetical protein L6164_001347 [Bauhinia variegata]
MLMGFSCGEDFDKESGTVLIDDNRAMQQNNVIEVQHHHQHGDDNDADFWPVEHPVEPRDEDRPVKCPMPESSVINDGAMHEKKFSESLRKRVEVPAKMANCNRERTAAMDPEPPARAVRKRHHTLTNGDFVITPVMRMPSLPPLPTQNVTIFQMLQEIDKFES